MSSFNLCAEGWRWYDNLCYRDDVYTADPTERNGELLNAAYSRYLQHRLVCKSNPPCTPPPAMHRDREEEEIEGNG